MAQCNVGVMYHKGQGVAQDFTKAREWWELAAAQGYSMAQCNLGHMHRDGQGGPQDFTRARELYELAAAQGYAKAMVGIGALFTNGQGVEQDLNEAMRWLLKAKAHGKDVSQQMAAVMEVRKGQNAQSQQTSIPGPAPGAEVEVTGLVNRPELNGVRGRVVQSIPGNGRWVVELNDGYGKVKLKGTSLRVTGARGRGE